MSNKKHRSKYRFHADYTKEVAEDGKQTKLQQVDAIKHPQLENDAFWMGINVTFALETTLCREVLTREL